MCGMYLQKASDCVQYRIQMHCESRDMRWMDGKKGMCGCMQSAQLRIRYKCIVKRGDECKKERKNESSPPRGKRINICTRVARRWQGYSSAVPSLPAATSSFQSARHRVMLARKVLSPRVFSIHNRSESSSSGTKNEESKERIVSKLAAADVM